ncbi:hypothetical protein HIM_06776 [Hirsutella minnesotensis 3608]|uniref:Uncharacterized protein n=1 Tax=Hirsutella minnesotensis 3608 TaxID=1043627 RepID=A0A0F7ZTX7_9HYPO|nr:hypothetical protein HIM_06776 [Hirsutella minnesotensis 3608]
MGLPLFVAPIESDVPAKAAAKGSASSPGRSGIRRSHRSDSRDRRNAVRTASVRIYGAVQPRMARSAQDSLLPWVESPGPMDQNLPEPRPRPAFQEPREARETPWQRSLNDFRQRDQFEEQMASLFGSDWRERGAVPAPPAAASQPGTDTRDTDERPSSRLAELNRGYRARRAQRRAQLLAQAAPPLPARFGRSSEGLQSLLEPNSTTVRAMRVLERAGDSGVDTNRASGPRHESRLLRSIREGRSPAIRSSRGLDGLGDRDRSVSPEVWDTLLSTLTPDPQPPSAGSSFVSTAASQSAGQSSSTATSAPDVSDMIGDGQCDSGCEHSDVNMDDDEENMDLSDLRTRQTGARDEHRGDASLSIEGPFEGNPGNRLAARRVTTQSQMDEVGSSSEPGRQDASSNAASDGSRGLPLARLLNRTEGWGSAASLYQAPGEESGGDESRATEPEPASGGERNMEEDWMGMQHIVRSLARREDIPDEWWAEVGLSRTLPQDASNQ